MRKILGALFLVALSGCTTPCPKLERYVCPDYLGTTWVAQDQKTGCHYYVCSVGGRGGFVPAP